MNALIIQGAEILDPELRKPIYARALELSSGMATEIPTYQRKNIFVYNKTTINEATLVQPDRVTPFFSPIQLIWEVELLD